MNLIVDRIGDSPSPLHFEASPEWLAERLDAGPGPRDGLVEAVQVDLEVHRMGEGLYLEGRAEGAFEVTCGRCLTRYREPIREAFRLVLESAGDRVPADPEGAEGLSRDGLYLTDELEAGWFRGPQVDLGPFVVEVIALGWPVQPLCREDCKGLCPRCGVDRNVESCDCSEARPESPFAVLEQLKGRLDPAGRTGGSEGES